MTSVDLQDELNVVGEIEDSGSLPGPHVRSGAAQ